jgi:hypothetical protein
LLLANDPFLGVGFSEGKILLPDSPGLGIVWRTTSGEGSGEQPAD